MTQTPRIRLSRMVELRLTWDDEHAARLEVFRCPPDRDPTDAAVYRYTGACIRLPAAAVAELGEVLRRGEARP